MDKNLFLQFWLVPIRNGLLQALGATNLHTLMGLASYINDRGTCNPSEIGLSKRLGLKGGAPAVSLRIKQLETIRWKGQSVIKVIRKGRVKDKKGKYKWEK